MHQLLQQSVGDLLNRARASTFDPESQKTLQGSLSQLSRAQREQSGLAGRPGGSHNSLSGQGEMSEALEWDEVHDSEECAFLLLSNALIPAVGVLPV